MFYRIMSFIIYPFIRIFIRVKYYGKENIPKNKGYILAANHISMADVFAIAVPVKGQICYMAKAELFKFKPLKWFFTSLGGFAVNRGKGDTDAIDKACNLVNNGKVMGIFPEGTRSKTGEPGKAKPGVALIAMQTKADILPVSVKYSTGRFKFFCKATVRIGEIIPYAEPVEDESQRAAIRRISESLMNNIKELWEIE